MKTLPFLLVGAVLASTQVCSQADVAYSTILAVNQSITGVRGYDETSVILTGTQQVSGATMGMWWRGSLSTGVGTTYGIVPNIPGQTVTTSNFYGPNTALFNPDLGAGNIRVVGTYKYTGSTVNDHGVMYTGALDGSGTWTQIDLPSSMVGGAVVEDTIPHSTMGNFVVGNYDLQGVPASANAFLYNISGNSWTLLDIGGTSNLTSAYGIWQNGETSYTIAGGSQHEGANKAFLVNYSSVSGLFTDLKFFEFEGAAGVTHFEGITGAPGGYNLVGTTDDGGAFAYIPRNLDGTFGDATWTPVSYPGNSGLSTGDTVFENIAMGVYTTEGVEGVQSYTATVPEPSVSLLIAGGVFAMGAVCRFRSRAR